MRDAREILQDYRERKQADSTAESPEALREENLRRLLRHAGAARQPSPQLEDRLLPEMVRLGAARQARRRWFRLSPLAWQLWAPAAAALAVSAAVVAVQFHGSHSPGRIVTHLSRPGIDGRPAIHDQPAALHPALIGYVILGDLQRRHPGETSAEPVGGGAEIRLGDEVSTTAQESGSVVFLDSSVCRVLPSTLLRYTDARQTGLKRPGLLILTRGETWNTVEKGGPPFVVRTYSATATVWGTQFGVAVDGNGKTTLRVKEGKVELQGAQSAVLVAAGMQSSVLPGQAPSHPVSLLTPARPPRRNSQPAPVHTTPGGETPGQEPSEQNDKTIHRLPPAAPGASLSPSSTDATPPGAPADSSGAPHSSGDGDPTPRPPISTSPQAP